MMKSKSSIAEQEDTPKHVTKVKAKVIDDIEVVDGDSDDNSDDEKVVNTTDDEGDTDDEDDEDNEDDEDDEDDEGDTDNEEEPEKKDMDLKQRENVMDSNYQRIIKVTRDEDRITSNVMTIYEYSEVIGIRTTQIEQGMHVFTDVEGLESAHDMAVKELFDRRCPLKIIRRLGKFSQEEFKCNEMAFPIDIRSDF